MVNVMEEIGIFLIVLDACPYDYFSEVYGNFFDGKLDKFCQASQAMEELTGILKASMNTQTDQSTKSSTTFFLKERKYFKRFHG